MSSEQREEHGCRAAASDSQPVSAEYILQVQSLIEQCLLLNMNCDECVDALSTHSNVKPVVTLTVWNELKKENKSFFTAYEKHQETGKHCRALMEEMRKLLVISKPNMMTSKRTKEQKGS
ncbi:uncharacterized protein LOC9643458 [Selaginella moellendorffii]|uniref:uncharacterized protein LOC9643458 n=1 Tax=Selaginella moellendorffii TaxID=88036 RepID=UPI000D1CA1FF|nr:uncharacterized protein LOC9643458 [Selaginella moellendorffii]|eukprot:XP_024524108.1 uncharacterized protein LOC9643458 [Selaginella moellendorffii]